MQSATISHLKTHLSAEIKKLKKTGGLRILQRDLPVAVLLPVGDESGIKIASVAKTKYRQHKPYTNLAIDPVEMLLEDRRKQPL